jgi:Xaa-Pro aminopeptidase
VSDNRGYEKCQALALQAAREIGALIQPGWTELQAAELLEIYLRDHGVKSFFHKPFVWFGENTRFHKVKRYKDFQPTSRRVAEGEVMILDVAPILNGFTCDIGYTVSLGANHELDWAQKVLGDIKKEIPKLFVSRRTGREIWAEVDSLIKAHGYENIHEQYPFSVLGHRVHQVKEGGAQFGLLNFGWQSYWSLLSRGLLKELLAPASGAPVPGLWAVEPHLGAAGFGAKFEEILVFTGREAYWLSEGVSS